MNLEEKFIRLASILQPGEKIAVITNYIVPGIAMNRYFVTSFGRAFVFDNDIRELSIEKSFSQRVNLGHKTRISIYRLVLMAFIPILNPSDFEVGHKDGNHYNNHLNNLFWRKGSYLNKNIGSRNPFIYFDGMLDPDEIALPITDYHIPNIKPIYFVSNKGKVFSISNNSNRKLFLLKQEKTDDGYFRVTLYDNNNISKHYSVHRLVMMIFRYRPDFESVIINHKDCHRDNNFIDLYDKEKDNIEWCDSKYNSEYMIKCGNAYRQMSNKQLYAIINDLKNNIPVKEIAAKYNLSLQAIYNIKNGKTYKPLTGGRINGKSER